jgi:hypothetical protein
VPNPSRETQKLCTRSSWDVTCSLGFERWWLVGLMEGIGFIAYADSAPPDGPGGRDLLHEAEGSADGAGDPRQQHHEGERCIDGACARTSPALGVDDQRLERMHATTVAAQTTDRRRASAPLRIGLTIGKTISFRWSVRTRAEGREIARPSSPLVPIRSAGPLGRLSTSSRRTQNSSPC